MVKITNLISIVLILSWIGCALALDYENGVEMRQGEKAAERLFNSGIGQPWVGGNPPSFSSFDYPSRVWNRWDDPFFYYGHQGKTYHPYRYSYYPGYNWYPYTYRDYWYPYTYYSGHWLS